MSAVLESLLPFLAIIVVLVTIHELGHFVTGKIFGVKVLEFGLGYPPRLWAIKRGETEYSINVLPLGGFVRLLGEEDPTDPRSLAALAAWKRLVVMGAGSFMNFVLAVALFSIALMIPREVPAGRAQIVQVVPDSPAAQAGIQPGDIIYEIAGRDIKSVPEAGYNIRLHLGETMPVLLERTDATTGEQRFVELDVRPRWAPPDYVYTIQPGDTVDSVSKTTTFDRDTVRAAAGIETSLVKGAELRIDDRGEFVAYTVEEGDTVSSVARQLRVSEEAVAKAAGLPDPNRLEPGSELRFGQGATGIRIAPQYTFTESRSEGPIQALRDGWRATFDSLKMARNSIIVAIKGGEGLGITGPIGIAQTTGEVVREAGWKSLTDLAALLSINLAILNILPLPMLDGGRMTFVIIEMLRRGRRIEPSKEALVHLVGMVAMFILVIVLSYLDIARIVRGETLFR